MNKTRTVAWLERYLASGAPETLRGCVSPVIRRWPRLPWRSTYLEVQRYYDAEIHRFNTPDPVGPEEDFIKHFNRYNYAQNNPVRYTDPDGKQSSGFFDKIVNSFMGGNTNSENSNVRTGSTALASNLKQTVNNAPADMRNSAATTIANAKDAIPTPAEVAAGADKVALNAGRVEAVSVVVGSPTAAPAAAVSIGASFVAVVAEPTKERAISFGAALVSGGATNALKASGNIIPSKVITVSNQVVEEVKTATKPDKIKP